MRRTVSRRGVLLAAFGAAVLVGAVLLLTVGRGGVATHGPVISNEKPWIPLGDSGSDALVGGVLTMENKCLLLDGNAVVWPSGTRWNGDQAVLELPGGATAVLGDRVIGGGGYFGGDETDTWSNSNTGRATASCQQPGTEVVVFNRSDEPDVA